MSDEKPNHELDDFFRNELENLPEEKPSADNWEQMNKRIHSEGLLKSNSNGRKYLLFFLLLLFLSGLVTLPFLIKDKNVNTGNTNNEVVKHKVPGDEDLSKQNIASERGKTGISEERAANSDGDSGNGKEGATYLSSRNTSRANDIDRNVSHEKKQFQDNDLGSGAAATAALIASTDNPQTKNDVEENMTGDGTNAASTQGAVQDEKMVPDTTTAPDSTNTSPQDSLAAEPNDSTNKDGGTKLKRFRLGFYVSWDYNYYSLKENSNVAQAESDFVSQSEFIEGENFLGQYTIGIMAGYLFTEKLSIEAGAFYSQKKKLHADIYTPTYTSSGGQPMFSDFSYDYNAMYFEIYGRGKYYLSRKKNSFYATLGGVAGYNLPAGNDSTDYFSRTSYGESGRAAERVTMDASSVNFTMVISAGVEIPLGKSWDVYIEPAYRYSFTPVVKHPTYDRIPIEHFLRSISLATGLMYKF